MIEPLFKWAGGKSKLVSSINELFPTEYSSYYEPFVGAGALFFNNYIPNPNFSYNINDLNPNVVNFYNSVREDFEYLIQLLTEYEQLYNKSTDKKELYLKIREDFNNNLTLGVLKAAQFLFLNKTCFNGLYRENKKGKFNVPVGTPRDKLNLFDYQNMKLASIALQNTKITNLDFELITPDAPNSLFYFDPPYRPITNTASFTEYNKGGFNDESQIRLKKYCDSLHSQGHKWILSNSDPLSANGDTFFEELYKDYNIRRVNAARNINSDGKGRGKVSELLITNF